MSGEVNWPRRAVSRRKTVMWTQESESSPLMIEQVSIGMKITSQYQTMNEMLAAIPTAVEVVEGDRP